MRRLIACFVFWSLLALALYAFFAVCRVPAPRYFLIYLALAIPVVSLAGTLSNPDWDEHQRKIEALSGKQFWKIENAGSWWWSSLFMGVFLGGSVFVAVAEARGLPSVPSIATPIGAMLLINWLATRTHQHRRWRAMREIGRIPICAACGHELVSLAASCTECGWREEATRTRPRTPLGTKLAAVALACALTLLPLSILAVPTADARAESAAVAKVDALLASAGVAFDFSFARTPSPAPNRCRVVTGFHWSASGEASWTVLVDDAMQPLAWRVVDMFGGPIAGHDTQMFDPIDLFGSASRRTIGEEAPQGNDLDVHPAERPNDR